MIERVLIAGSGGQGIILAGKLLATAAAREIPHVTLFPSYGAEVRGGTCSSQAIFSSDEIASPLPECFDSMLLMNRESADAFLPRAAENCLVLFNGSARAVPEGRTLIALRATEYALQLGETRVANLIMLGAYLSRKPLVPLAYVEEELRRSLSGKAPALVELNLKAFRAGLTHAA